MSSPDIARLRGVYLRGIEGRSCTHVPQAPYNKANGRLGVAQRVKIFRKCSQNRLVQTFTEKFKVEMMIIICFNLR